MKMGSPHGERHGKVKVPDSTVKEIRDRFYDRGDSVIRMSREYGIPEFTIRDWVAFKTRVHF